MTKRKIAVSINLSNVGADYGLVCKRIFEYGTNTVFLQLPTQDASFCEYATTWINPHDFEELKEIYQLDIRAVRGYR